VKNMTRYAWHSKIACRQLEDTAFILLNSRMISLDPIGSRIWQWFEQGSTVGEAAEKLNKEYEVSVNQAQLDVKTFVDDLCERELLVACESESSANALAKEQK